MVFTLGLRRGATRGGVMLGLVHVNAYRCRGCKGLTSAAALATGYPRWTRATARFRRRSRLCPPPPFRKFLLAGWMQPMHPCRFATPAVLACRPRATPGKMGRVSLAVIPPHNRSHHPRITRQRRCPGRTTPQGPQGIYALRTAWHRSSVTFGSANRGAQHNMATRSAARIASVFRNGWRHNKIVW